MADADGLLAIGGELSTQRLILAYTYGIFPWYNERQPLLWWCTHPRFVLFPNELHIQKSMRPLLNRNAFEVTFDRAFGRVIANCSKSERPGQNGTWVTPEMQRAYIRLNEKGYARSVEVWDGDELAGGLYGIQLGKVFYGESMFANRSNASKYGFIKLVRQLQKEDFLLIDCQQETQHLRQFGARLIELDEFLGILRMNWRYRGGLPAIDL